MRGTSTTLALRSLLAMLITLPASAAASPGPDRASPARQTVYGAIAYSPEDKPGDFSFGRAFGTNRQKTVQDAAKDCWNRTKGEGRRARGAGDCETVVWFSDGGGSLARASNGSYGSGWGPTIEAADANALRVCSEDGGKDCHLIVRMLSNPSPSAKGGGVGRVCFFRGISFGVDVFVQHAGWAYRSNNRKKNPWVFGATEGPVAPLTGPWYVPPGSDDRPVKDARSWEGGDKTWSFVKRLFKIGGAKNVDYYKSYRCRDTTAVHPTKAWNQFDTEAHRGFGLKDNPKTHSDERYTPYDNNCLTHAVATFRAYGASDLPHVWGPTVLPKVYQDTVLTQHGFLPDSPL